MKNCSEFLQSISRPGIARFFSPHALLHKLYDDTGIPVSVYDYPAC